MNVNVDLQDRFRMAVALFTGDMAALMADTVPGVWERPLTMDIFIPPPYKATLGLSPEADGEVREIGRDIISIEPMRFQLGQQEYILWHDPAENRIHWTEGRRSDFVDDNRRIGIWK